MSDSHTDRRISTFFDDESETETAVIALLAEDEYARAETVISGLCEYSGYEEWRESREGFQMGLAMAGVEVKMVPVAVTPFLAWCRLAKTPSSEGALDAFAAMVLRFRSRPKAAVLAIVDEREFQEYSRDVAALSAYCDYQHWLRHRRVIRIKVAMSNPYVEEFPIILSDFVRWRECVNRISEPSIDNYAELILEYLTSNQT
jgi:hypothetical protein